MVCAHCGSALPPGALFCGECGRSVAPTAATVKAKSAPSRRPVSQRAAPGTADATPAPARPAKKKSDTNIIEPVDAELAPNEQLVAEVAPTTKDVLFIDLEATRIVTSMRTGDRFVLQFSTGESVTVFGTGLIGRHPVAEPGEYFDHVVTISDPSKSVSKTHLEFGQAGGAFWISDRHSGNGTLIREPDSEPRRCDPGKRYRIVRGTRVSIGEQFFVVS